MYCPKCGVQNSEGATHCVNCDSVLMDVPSEPVTGQVPPGYAVSPPKTYGLAVAAFVMGLLSMTCILWPLLALPAIICAIIALVKIGNSNGQLKGTGLAIAGLIIPAVFLFIVPILMAILMPALSQVKHVAQRTVCATNLRGLAVAMTVYANDYDDTLPAEDWCDLLIEKADVSPKSFVCPDSDAVEGESSYALNENLAGMNSKKMPPDVVLFFETDKGKEPDPRDTSIKSRRYFECYRVYDDNTLVYKNRFNQLGGPDDVVLRHKECGRPGCNVAFVDGHVEFVTENRIPDLKWTIEE
jgi:prepilin-type processing-associated H-X9-DG protein